MQDDRFIFRLPVVESSYRIGEHVETVSFTESHVVVSYSGPPIPQDVQDRLAEYWRRRIDRIMWEVMCGPGAFSGAEPEGPTISLGSLGIADLESGT